MLRKLRFAIFGNVYQAKKSASILEILSYLHGHNADVYIEREFFDFLTCGQNLDVCVSRIFEGCDFDADFVISMGGDGTLLKAATFVGDKNIPIIGVNMGRLGFLADIVPGEIEEALDAIYSGEYMVERHTVIAVRTSEGQISGCPCALNDVAVLKRDNASMISIRVSINGEYLVTYQADGLVISTPTGSTAYSLSNGGPIITPDTGILCLTPVAPHSLNIRPIVIPDTSRVDVSVESRSHNYLVAIDGRSEKCMETERLTISKAPYTIKIVKRTDRKYFVTLREKMMWGADNR